MTLLFVFLIGIGAWADEKIIPVEFENTIETCMPAKDLWTELSKAMSSSEGNWLWPRRRSSVIGEGVFEGSQVEVTYRSFLFSPTYSYRLENVEPGVGFDYVADQTNHPFEGGARVEAIDKGSLRQLIWEGLYLTKESDWIARRFFENYTPKFFADLEKNIRNKEPTLCK